ncbi:restriction endonuclease subunit S [Bifidobacterium longum]|uniref:restriction endonuclease subunit S n=1 Tax=Bifidobacterium longum TaxID=216816 RepID=UPI001C38D3A3|nr:restriction endonuclease subunit S [Bifidobacterium longum]
MAEQAKVPAIRFAGFTDPWEQRKLGELALTYSGGTPSAGNSAYYGGEIPFIRSAEIDCDSTELSLTVAGLNNSSAKLVDKGMVLYAMYGATSGEVAISKIKGAINQAILAMDASDMAANRFIAYWLRRQKKSITETFLQGGQGNLSGAIIKELGIPQPSLDEQRQIGSFFSNLDDLITLHQRKYDKLVIFKKSMLEKMFPKDGESVPEIRFAGFTDPWEQRKLGEIADKVTEKNLDGNITEVLTNSAEYGVINQTEFFDHAVAKESNIAGYYVIAPGDFVYNPRISATAPVGPIRRNTLGIHGVMSPLYTVFRLTDAVDGTYLSHFFKTNGWHGFMKLEGNSGARSDRFSIGDATFFEMPIPVPSSSEQHAIGSFFSRLDDLITLHQRKLELLQNIKKSLLDKMFV